QILSLGNRSFKRFEAARNASVAAFQLFGGFPLPFAINGAFASLESRLDRVVAKGKFTIGEPAFLRFAFQRTHADLRLAGGGGSPTVVSFFAAFLTSFTGSAPNVEHALTTMLDAITRAIFFIMAGENIFISSRA